MISSIIHPPTKDQTQFLLLLTGLICMGSSLGFERSLLPRMSTIIFNNVSSQTRLNFVATFGLSKALANIISGPLADHFGRKPSLIWGFVVGLPVMPYIIFAESWRGITLINILFGLSQGLIGSSLMFYLIDVLGPERRGIAVGIGECTIYVSTAVVNVLAGDLASRYGYRPVPFMVATGFSALGLLSTFPLFDTLDRVKAEQNSSGPKKSHSRKKELDISLIGKNIDGNCCEDIETDTDETTSDSSSSQDITLSCSAPTERSRLLFSTSTITTTTITTTTTSYSGDTSSEEDPESSSTDQEDIFDNPDFTQQTTNSPIRTLLNLLTNTNYLCLCFTGMAINFKDGFAWGTFPVYFSMVYKLKNSQVDLLIALYPLTWGFVQGFSGYLSDIYGRKLFLVSGMALCTIAMSVYTWPHFLSSMGSANIDNDDQPDALWSFGFCFAADILLGLGTALIYPVLQAAAADEVDPVHRGLGLGFYRFVRDMGYVVGAVVCGRLTDDIGYDRTFGVVSVVMGFSFVLMLFVFEERKPCAQEERRWSCFGDGTCSTVKICASATTQDDDIQV